MSRGYFSRVRHKGLIHVAFGVASSLLQAWMWYLLSVGRPTPRLAFLLGPFAFFFLFMGLHPAFRGDPRERSSPHQQIVFGVLVVCMILAVCNYRFMHRGS